MDSLLQNEKLVLFCVLVFPGLITMHIYRLLMPAKAIVWANAILEALFYTAVNFTICLPLLVFILRPSFLQGHPYRAALGLLLVLLVAPVLSAVGFVRLMRSTRVTRWIQLPYPTAWDAFFDRRRACFVLIHLKDGSLLGGYYGAGSYATSHPNEGDIYVAAVYQTDATGKFIAPMPDTRGLLIRKDEYSYMEFFDVPTQSENTITI